MARILLVDDDPPTRDLIGKILARKGYEIFLAASVAEALEMLESGMLPDLIISDLAMPERDGLDLLRTVREAAWGVSLPFIFLTARPTPGNLYNAQEAKADAFISKPVSIEALHEIVSSFISPEAL